MHLTPEQRTTQQNRALHLFFTHLSEELNNAGLDMRKTLKPSVDIPWTPQAIKEYIWRPVQMVQLQKRSTTELTTDELTRIYDTINRHLGDKFGLHVPFPSVESLYETHTNSRA